MPIIFHETSKTFHLYNKEISYIFKIMKNGQAGQIYYGKRIHDQDDYEELLQYSKRDMAPCAYEGDYLFALENIKQEYPAFNHGDLRYPAYTFKHENGSTVSDFQYRSHSIYKGKKPISDLPSTYVEEECESDSLEISFYDAVSQTELILFYTIYNDLPVICRHAKFIQHANESITLLRAMSLSLDLPDKEYEMIELTGAWSRERHVECRELKHGVQSVYSMRGHSSHQYNPFIALKRKDTTEENGEVIGCALVYSGSFLAQAEVDNYDVTRLMIGIHPDQFAWPLSKEDSFETPEAVLVYSDDGLNAMSQTFHTLFQKRLVRGYWRDKERPILVNNWEATFMNFNEEKLLTIAKSAKELGIELFVLDDGWFGKRDDDTTSLGDWFVDYDKLPNGLNGLSDKIHDLGLMFGIWIEPEMISMKSKLYQKHPEWMMVDTRYQASHGRNQFVLDFSNPIVADGIFEMLDRVLENTSVDYIKWDMNRTMSEVYSVVHGENQGTVIHKYILGVYRLYEKLVQKYPKILFESCASGGARFDAGMLYYAPQAWCSDDTDAIERLKIQYGTSYLYPLSSIGAHVSVSPNQQVLRETPFKTRFSVACFGAFGYELDVSKFTEKEKEEVKEQITFMKKYRSVLQYGKFYRLSDPFTNNITAWMVVDHDQSVAIVGVYKVLQHVSEPYTRIRLQGLDPDAKYHVSVIDKEIYGDELMHAGIALSSYDHLAYGDFQSQLFVLTKEYPSN